MGKTIEELKKENAILEKKLKDKQEANRLRMEQNKLLQQNKILMRRSKHPVLFEASKRIGDVSIKAGKGVGKHLLKIARNMAEAEKREKALRRKVASKPRKKSTPKKRSTKKRKR